MDKSALADTWEDVTAQCAIIDRRAQRVLVHYLYPVTEDPERRNWNNVMALPTMYRVGADRQGHLLIERRVSRTP